MEYYRILNLHSEPFSNSPDPRLFFPTKHFGYCLQRLEIGVRLKRGLHVVTGEVGTGKTTICRKLMQRLGEDASVRKLLILDPGFGSTHAFLQELHRLFTGMLPTEELSERAIKEEIKQHLFTCAVTNNELVVLIIDESQKLSASMLELLRELLNYETASEKLLQIILFGQKELLTTINDMPNLTDRVNKFFTMPPLTLAETTEFIHFRIRRAAGTDRHPEFSKSAIKKIYKYTNGYPRQIIAL